MMVEDRRSTILHIIIEVVGLAILVLLLCWLFPMPDLNPFYDRVFTDNISTMKDAARNYYTTDRLPQNIGETKKMTLSDMVNSKMILEFVDKDNKTCDPMNSYIQVTKTIDQEYALKIQLSCGDKTDYIIDTIGCNGTCYGTTLEKEEGPSNTSKPSHTVNKPNNNDGNNNSSSEKPYVPQTVYYHVFFDSNGGSAVSAQKIEKGNTAYSPENPKRDGYIFAGWYLNGNLYNFSWKVTSDITLIARWNKIEENNQSLHYEQAPLEKKYTDGWSTDYPYGSLYDQDREYVKYYDVCKEESNTYYTVGYITKSQYNANKNYRGYWSYSYTLEVSDLPYNIDKLKVDDSKRMYTLNQFNSYVRTRDDYLSMVGATNSASKVYTSASNMKNAALRTSNFNFSIGKPRRVGSRTYVDIDITIKNLNDVTPYYASNVGTQVYFVPIEFTLDFVNKNSCSYVSEYDWTTGVRYEAGGRYETIYRPYQYVPNYNKTIWSLQSYLDGYQATGKTKWM